MIYFNDVCTIYSTKGNFNAEIELQLKHVKLQCWKYATNIVGSATTHQHTLKYYMIRKSDTAIKTFLKFLQVLITAIPKIQNQQSNSGLNNRKQVDEFKNQFLFIIYHIIRLDYSKILFTEHVRLQQTHCEFKYVRSSYLYSVQHF